MIIFSHYNSETRKVSLTTKRDIQKIYLMGTVSTFKDFRKLVALQDLFIGWEDLEIHVDESKLPKSLLDLLG